LVWTLSSGNHTTTSTVVPAGASTWDYTFTGVGDSYSYVLTVPGDYEYVCTFHPMMVGTVRVAETLPLEENFDYTTGQVLTDVSLWKNHSGTGTFLTVESGSLSYSGYPASGVGNSTRTVGGSGSREDINRIFTEQSGNVYAGVLVNVSAATSTADYFFHFSEMMPSTNFRCRVFVQDNGAGGFQFGISKGTSTITMAPGTYSYNTTYLLVVKYEMVGDLTGNDDVAKLFINPDLTAAEPTADATSTDVISDSHIAGVCLTQGAQAYDVQVDGIRVSTSWENILPVELSSFSAASKNNGVALSWTTATEINNAGFEIERKSEKSDWNKIAFVDGKGTTSSVQNYTFFDGNLTAGKYQYRLKQIDFDGSFEYSNVVEVIVNTPSKFELSQNYPNPFNPSTKISFSLPQTGHVSLKVYNALGQEVAQLINGVKEAGIHTIEFNAGNLNSGIYFYKLESGNLNQVKKMMLVK